MKIAVDVVRTIRQERGELRDPKNTRPITITTCNFKGGVSKTTTTATLAQGLALRGFNVLLIDADPQGSLSSLFGFNTATEVQEKNTLLPIFQPLDPDETDPEVIESSASVVPAIQTTYWENIHMIAANMGLYGAEFSIPSTQARDPQAMFWNILHERLEELREINLHDVIIIDTPPSLSYLTINALMASDGLLMPLPPANLDFASSAQFWALITELLENFKQMRDFEKKLSFIDVLFAKVDHAEQMQSEVREWILNAYRGKVLPIEIPKTATASTASASYGTVYDMEPGAASAKTLKRALDAYERMVDIIEEQMFGVWNWQADQKKD